MGKPSAPPAPDYTAAAQAQGAANKETAITQGYINNPNVNTPLGSQTVTWAPGGQFDENAFNQALQQYQSGGSFTGLDGLSNTGSGPTRDQFTTHTSGENQPTITQKLTPEGQARFDQEQRIVTQLGGMAENGLGRVNNSFSQPFDTSQFPGWQYGVDQQNFMNGVPYQDMEQGYGSGGPIQYSNGYNQPLQYGLGNYGQAQSSFGDAGGIQRGIGGYGQAQGSFADVGGPSREFGDAGQLQRGLDYSGVSRLPTTDDFGAERQKVEQAIYSRLDPQFQRDEDSLRTRLINQGLTPGTEAWDAEAKNFNQSKNDARMQAVLAGGQEQSRLFGMGMAGRQQGVNEVNNQGNFANAAQQAAFGQAQARGQFGNQAQAQAYEQALGRGMFGNAAQQQNYNQMLGAGQFANQAQGQAFGQEQARGQFANEAQNQNYLQGLGAGTFANAAQGQGYGQAQGNQAAWNAAQQQANSQNANQAGFANQARIGNFGMGQQNAQMYNQNAAQRFQQAMQNAQFGNTTRQNALQEAMMQRNLPLNEINALRSGSQVQMPQFQGYQGSNISPAPLFNATQAQGQADMGLYNAQMGSSNATTGGIAALGSAALMFF